MIIYPLSQRPNGRDIEFVIRLERAITRIAAQYGFDGDPLAERFPEADTEAELWAACDLLQALPVELRNWDRRVAHRMCKAAVFGRTRSNDVNLTCFTQPTVDAKFERERIRKSRRASA